MNAKFERSFMRSVILMCFTLIAVNVHSADGELSSVESGLKDYYSAIAGKKIDRAISFFHPESAKIERAKSEMEEFSKQFEISYKISAVKEVGRIDGDIVISFVEDTTFSVADGKQLNTFKAKVLMVWRKDKSGVYKIWDSLPLSPAKAENTDKSKR